MAAARELLSTTLTGTTNMQFENRQGNRKRKQDMPSASAHTNSTAASKDAVSQQPTDNMAQVLADKRLSASIQAVVSFNFSEESVLSCALDMQKDGRTVNSGTLLSECELRFPDESSLQSFNKEVGNTRRIAVSEPLGASSALSLELSNSSLPYFSSQSSSHDCPEYLSLQSANISCSSTSGKTDCPINIPTKGSEQSRYMGANGYKHTPSHSAGHSCVPSRQPSDFGEDCVDGHLLSPLAGVSDGGLNMWAQSSIESMNDLNKSDFTAMPTSLPLATGNLVSNLARQEPESLSRPQSGPSHFNKKNNVSDLTHVCTVFTDIATTSRENNIAKDVELETKRNNDSGESMSLMRESNRKNAELKKLCFSLVEKEHALLEKSRLCSLCLSRPRDVTFLPCGHFTSCRTCAEPTYVCPCCNKNILATVDTYLS